MRPLLPGLLIPLLLVPILFAQPSAIDWAVHVQNPTNDPLAVHSMAFAPDGCLFTMTRTIVGSSDPNVLAKLDPDGTVLWSLILDEPPLAFKNGALVSDGEGGVVICGKGWQGMHIARLDGDGNALWNTEIFENESNPEALCKLRNGGYAMAGGWSDSWTDEVGFFVAGFDENGVHDFTSVINFNTLSMDVTDVVELHNGSIVVCGGIFDWYDHERRAIGAVNGTSEQHEVLWTHERGSEDDFDDMVVGHDGNIHLLDADSLFTYSPEGTLLNAWDPWVGYGTRITRMSTGGYMLTNTSGTHFRTNDNFQNLWTRQVGGNGWDDDLYATCSDEYGAYATGGRGGSHLFVARLVDEIPHVVTLTLTPTSSTALPAAGGTITFDTEIVSDLANPRSANAWTRITLPSGLVTAPLIVVNLTVPPGPTMFAGATQAIPAQAPAGEYVFTAHLGFYPATIAVSDEFEFTKAGTLTSTGETPVVLPAPKGLAEPKSR